VPPRSPSVIALGALERPRDHPAHRVLAAEDPTGGATGVVQLLERHHTLVGRDLKDAVGRRVDDPAPGALVLGAEPLDDLRARRGHVAEHPAAGRARELVQDLVREPVGVGRERPLGDDAHHLPVPGGRVHPLRALDQAAPHRRRVGAGRAAAHLHHVSEPERLHGGHLEAAHRLGGMGERRGSRGAVLRGVRQVSHPDGVEDDDAGPRHGPAV